MKTQREQKVLVYLGFYKGATLRKLYKDYDMCYAFEANPEFVERVKKEYSEYSNIRIILGALTSFDGEIDFNLSSNDGASSSIGSFNEAWSKKRKLEMTKKVKVPAINLYNFCVSNRVEHITDYISDLQGMDLEVLKTMKPYLDNKKIDTVTCEVTKNEHNNIYHDLPSNKKSDFEKILSANYIQTAEGWGSPLKDWSFVKMPDDWWEMDCKWTLKEKIQQVKPIVWSKYKEAPKMLQIMKRVNQLIRSLRTKLIHKSQS